MEVMSRPISPDAAVESAAGSAPIKPVLLQDPDAAEVYSRAFPSYDARMAAGAGFTDWAKAGQARDREVAASRRGSTIPGFSVSAGHPVDFVVRWPADATAMPNWRETVACPVTRLTNRVRAAYGLLLESAPEIAKVYLTERRTTLYTHMASSRFDVTGSEFVAGAERGSITPKGVRIEDVTQLTFDNASFDAILSLDVLEHVPDYGRALVEFSRVLRADGVLLLSVPFLTRSAATTIRARIGADGNIEHLRPPEYHGDPMSKNGVLCFYHFGWDLLNDLRSAGFRVAEGVFYWSDAFGYLGMPQFIIRARNG